MNERIDEEIGALLDGRLESGPRTELLARLAASDEDFDVFADTAGVLREAEEGELAENEPIAISSEEPERSADVIPLRPRRASGWRSPAVRWLAAAAVLAGFALIPVLGRRAPRLPADWGHAWSVTRGNDVVGQETGIISRIGALHADLEVAVGSKSFDQASLLARQIAALAENISGGGLLSQTYGELAAAADQHDSNLKDSVAAAKESLDAFLGGGSTGGYLSLGGWTEAARLAAARQDAEFFRTLESLGALETAGRMNGLNDEARAAVARLRSVPQQREIRDWESLSRDLDTLQRELAR